MDAIAGGRLSSSDQLPSHRELSEKLVIAPLTVKKAYGELESLGYIETMRGRGTFVAARFPKVTRATQIGLVEDDARTLLARAYLLGLEYPDVVRALKHADRDLLEHPAQRHSKKGRSA
jgi:GntR family transcriptional regulator